MACILNGVLESDVFFAELVIRWRGSGKVNRRNGGRVGGGDGGLVGWGAVEGVLEDTFRSLCRGAGRRVNLGRSICSHCGGGHQGKAVVELLGLGKAGCVLYLGTSARGSARGLSDAGVKLSFWGLSL